MQGKFQAYGMGLGLLIQYELLPLLMKWYYNEKDPSMSHKYIALDAIYIIFVIFMTVFGIRNIKQLRNIAEDKIRQMVERKRDAIKQEVEKIDAIKKKCYIS